MATFFVDTRPEIVSKGLSVSKTLGLSEKLNGEEKVLTFSSKRKFLYVQIA